MGRKFLLLGLLVLGLSNLGGCIFWGGSDKVQQPTVGQQLLDLQAAREKGAITEEEFEQKKTALLEKKQESVARTASYKGTAPRTPSKSR